MGIQSNKKRKSMLGSVQVSSLEAEMHNNPEVVQSTQNMGEENNIAVQPAISGSSLKNQNEVNKIETQSSRLGRKRRELIPGERERNFTIQLPESLINKMKVYGLEHGKSMKDIIGEMLVEKFM